VGIEFRRHGLRARTDGSLGGASGARAAGRLRRLAAGGLRVALGAGGILRRLARLGMGGRRRRDEAKQAERDRGVGKRESHDLLLAQNSASRESAHWPLPTVLRRAGASSCRASRAISRQVSTWT